MIPILTAAGVALKLLQGPVSQILDRHIADRQTRDKLAAELQQSLIEQLAKEQESAASVIIAESKSEHWLTANWRPLLTVVLMAFLVLVGLLIPLADLVAGGPIPYRPRWSDLPEGFWQFLTVGMGGYIGGRSLEKIAGQWLARK
jgi:phenylpyruvate tautomerase PptA (4-oxalocrotonate tautomerase family)